MKFGAGTITVYDRNTGQVLHQGECLDFEVTPEKPALKDEDLMRVDLEGTAGQIQMAIAPVSFWTKIQTHPAIQVAYENGKREQQGKVTAAASSEFFDKLVNHPQAQKAKRRLETKVLGAQWKRERKGFRP